MTTQSQDIGKTPSQINPPGKPGVQKPSRPNEDPMPHSGQDKGNKGTGRQAPSRPV